MSVHRCRRNSSEQLGPRFDRRLNIGALSIGEEQIAILLSQDCDVVHLGDGEPQVEFCIGKILQAEVDGNYTYGKNARVLHLPARFRGTSVHIELRASDRCFCERTILCTEKPSTEHLLSEDSVHVLIDWIIGRYSRDPFPDSFNARIREPLAKKIPSLLKKLGQDVVCFYVAMNSWEELDRGRRYIIELIAVMQNSKYEDPKLFANAQRLVKELATLLHVSTSEGDVDVVNASVLSEKSVSLHDERYLRRLDFDYVSLRDPTKSDIKPIRKR